MAPKRLASASSSQSQVIILSSGEDDGIDASVWYTYLHAHSVECRLRQATLSQLTTSTVPAFNVSEGEDRISVHVKEQTSELLQLISIKGLD
eukprot:6491291-Amphidinium_carterae.2